MRGPRGNDASASLDTCALRTARRTAQWPLVRRALRRRAARRWLLGLRRLPARRRLATATRRRRSSAPPLRRRDGAGQSGRGRRPREPLAGNGFDPRAIYAAPLAGRGHDRARTSATEPGHGATGPGLRASSSRPKGYILTNAHVITTAGAARSASRAASRSTSSSRTATASEAKIVGWDVFDDVGCSSVEPRAHALAPVPLGNSAGSRRSASRSRRSAAPSGTRTRSPSASSRRPSARSTR